jgi:hypothetical protein
MATRFPNGLEVFEAPDRIEQADPSDPIYRGRAVMVTRRGGGSPIVVDAANEMIGRLGRTYVHDEIVAQELRDLADDFEQVRAVFQARWERILSRTTKVQEGD